MGMKKSWLSLVKKRFIPEAKSEEKKKTKKWRFFGQKTKKWRWMFGKLKFKSYPALAAPQKTFDEAAEEQRKHAVTIAIATAAAAEAAIAAAKAAAEVVKLTSFPREFGKKNAYLAAIKIQCVFRGHLARKALRALKGVVKLQAVIRGQITRHRVMKKLKYLPSTAKSESQIHAPRTRVSCVNESDKAGANIQNQVPRKELENNAFKIDSNTAKCWDYSLASKEDIEALLLRKEEAIIKRERMKKYSCSHWEMRTNQSGDGSRRQSNRFEPLADVKTNTSVTEKSTVYSNLAAKDSYGTLTPSLRNGKNSGTSDTLNLKASLPRRSFSHAKKRLIGDESSLTNSPVFPTYMAVTESAKAKARSLSTPKQRIGLFDAYSGRNSPYKFRLSS